MHNSPFASGEERFVEEKTVNSLKGPEQRSCISAALAPAARENFGPSVPVIHVGPMVVGSSATFDSQRDENSQRARLNIKETCVFRPKIDEELTFPLPDGMFPLARRSQPLRSSVIFEPTHRLVQVS
jgi:hypothetical protein